MAWVVVGAICLLGLVVTLVALFTENRGEDPLRPDPAWLVPAPREVRSARFPRAWRGYHPASVDVFLAALGAAYEELYEVAGPDAVAEARERLSRRASARAGGVGREVR